MFAQVTSLLSRIFTQLNIVYFGPNFIQHSFGINFMPNLNIRGFGMDISERFCVTCLMNLARKKCAKLNEQGKICVNLT